MRKDVSLGKDEAQLISGCAILMMVIHHFFGFKEFLIDGNSYVSLFSVGGIESERILAAFGKLCVAIFAFCSGYAIWAVSSQYTSWYRIFKRIGKFLQAYWIICILFIVFGLCLGLRMPSIKDFGLNLIGLGTGPFSPYVNVVFGWYVAFYCCLLLLAPFLLKLFLWRNNHSKKVGKSFLIDLFYLLAISAVVHVLSNSGFDFINPLPAAICGLLTAKWNLFGLFNELKPAYRSMWVSVPVIFLLIPIRQGLIWYHLSFWGIEDGIFSLLFIYAVLNIFNCLNSRMLRSVFMLLGRYSMNLWFLHGIFFMTAVGGSIQLFLYWPRYSIFILLWGLVLLLPIAMGVAVIQNKVWIMTSKALGLKENKK